MPPTNTRQAPTPKKATAAVKQTSSSKPAAKPAAKKSAAQLKAEREEEERLAELEALAALSDSALSDSDEEDEFEDDESDQGVDEEEEDEEEKEEKEDAEAVEDDDSDEGVTDGGLLYSGEGVVDGRAMLAEGMRSHVVGSREDDVTYDLGNLVAFDAHPVERAAGKDAEKALLRAARETAQLLCNRIFSLPTTRLPQNEGVLCVLPAGATSLPRAKRVPEEKPVTKWEEFAKIRGIHRTKRERMVWDEQWQEWRPRFGYGRANDNTNDWVIEHSDSTPAGADPWKERERQKKERIDKNKHQRAANVARGAKQLPGEKSTSGSVASGRGGESKGQREKKRLREMLVQTNASTASIGHFNKLLPGEQKYKVRTKQASSRKPSFRAPGEEQQAALKVLDRMAVSDQIVDKDTAARRAIGTHLRQSGSKRAQKTIQRMPDAVRKDLRSQKQDSRQPKRPRSK